MYVDDNLATISLLFKIYISYCYLYYRIINKVYVGILAHGSGEGGMEVLHNWARISKLKSFSKAL